MDFCNYVKIMKNVSKVSQLLLDSVTVSYMSYTDML